MIRQHLNKKSKFANLKKKSNALKLENEREKSNPNQLHKSQFFNSFFFTRSKHSNQGHTTQLHNSNWTQLRKKKRSQIQREKKKSM